MQGEGACVQGRKVESVRGRIAKGKPPPAFSLRVTSPICNRSPPAHTPRRIASLSPLLPFVRLTRGCGQQRSRHRDGGQRAGEGLQYSTAPRTAYGRTERVSLKQPRQVQNFPACTPYRYATARPTAEPFWAWEDSLGTRVSGTRTRVVLPHAPTCDATEAAPAAAPASAFGGCGSASVTSVEPLFPAASR